VAADSAIFLSKKTRQARNKMDWLHALDQPDLFLHVHTLPDHSGHQATSIKDHWIERINADYTDGPTTVITSQTFALNFSDHCSLIRAIRDKKSKMDLAA
jgi:hypothetical protein